MNTNFHNPNHEAQAIKKFQETQAECTELLKRINDRIAQKGGSNLSWGALGDVIHTRNLLIEALAGVGGLTKEEMEKYRI